MKKGFFITFEGPDGSGKTTVSTAVAKRLQEKGIDTVYTREPGGIEIAEQIRSVIWIRPIRRWTARRKPCFTLQPGVSI